MGRVFIPSLPIDSTTHPWLGRGGFLEKDPFRPRMTAAACHCNPCIPPRVCPPPVLFLGAPATKWTVCAPARNGLSDGWGGRTAVHTEAHQPRVRGRSAGLSRHGDNLMVFVAMPSWNGYSATVAKHGQIGKVLKLVAARDLGRASYRLISKQSRCLAVPDRDPPTHFSSGIL